MMYDIIIGDEHARGKFKRIYENSLKDRTDIRFIICLGDYFDPYERIEKEEKINNFNEIVSFARKDERIKLLLGNHDVHYMIPTGESSRLDRSSKEDIKKLFVENIDILGICIELDNKTIVSHAGISNSWMEHYGYSSIEQINNDFKNLIKENPEISFDKKLKTERDDKVLESFQFYHFDNSDWGDHVLQPPTWIRPDSLLSEFDKVKWNTQIIGHTRTDVERMQLYVYSWPENYELGSIVEISREDDNNNKKLILVDTGDIIDKFYEREVID